MLRTVTLELLMRAVSLLLVRKDMGVTVKM